MGRTMDNLLLQIHFLKVSELLSNRQSILNQYYFFKYYSDICKNYEICVTEPLFKKIF